MDRRKQFVLSLFLSAALLTAAPFASAAPKGDLPFRDVRSEDPFYAAVSDIYERGLMNGTAQGVFSPYESATRAMMATVFWRMEGAPDTDAGSTFPDVPAGEWYARAVQWAADKGLYQGYADGLFHPAEPITKEQLCIVLLRYAQYKGAAAAADYTETERIRFSPWAGEACSWALGHGYFPDSGEALDMAGPALRWEIAEALYRFSGDCGGVQERTYGGLKYLLVQPPHPEAGMPLIVYLHGGSGKGEDLSLLTQEDGFPKYLTEGALGEVPAYVLIPQLPTEKKGWTDVSGEIAGMIREVCVRYALDGDRVALTGHSMGGTGTWALALAMPEQFSCIVPMSGSIRLTRENVTALSALPVRAFVGEEDTIVAPDSTLRFVEALQRAGGDAQVIVLPKTDHFGVPAAYLDADINIIAWMLAQNRGQ